MTFAGVRVAAAFLGALAVVAAPVCAGAGAASGCASAPAAPPPVEPANCAAMRACCSSM